MRNERLSNNTAEADQKLQDAKEKFLKSMSTFIDTIFRIQKEEVRRAATSAIQETGSQPASSGKACIEEQYSSSKEESSTDEKSNSSKHESSSDEQDYSISIEEEVSIDEADSSNKEEDNINEQDYSVKEEDNTDEKESGIKEEPFIDEQDDNSKEEVALRSRIRKILDDMDSLESEDVDTSEQDDSRTVEVALRASNASAVRKILDEVYHPENEGVDEPQCAESDEPIGPQGIKSARDVVEWNTPYTNPDDSEIPPPPFSQRPRRSERIKSSSSRTYSTTNH